MVFRGDLIIESLAKPGELPGFCVDGIRRVPGGRGPSVPRLDFWTILAVKAEDDAARPLADAYSRCCDPEFAGWYLDLKGADTHYFAFYGKVFAITRESAVAGYSEVRVWGREHGIPESQLDFSELSMA